MNHKYQTGEQVSARLCSTRLGDGVIVELTEGNSPPVPMYKVQTSDGTYPLYEDEVTPKREQPCSSPS